MRGLQYLHSIELAHGNLKGVRFPNGFQIPALTLLQRNVLISDGGRACLADIGLTKVAGDLDSPATPATPSGTTTARWSPPELLNPERFGSRGGGPTTKSDIYSMGMTIYEVSVLRCTSGPSTEVVLGPYG